MTNVYYTPNTVKPEKESKWTLRAPKFIDSHENEHPKKTVKGNTTKSWSETPFWCQKWTTFSRVFGSIFELWAILGPKWVPSPPGRPQTLVFVDFVLWVPFIFDFDIK